MKMLNIGKMFFIISLSLSLRYELLSMYQQKMQFKNILFQPRQSGLIARTYVVDPLKKRASTSVQSLSKKREWNWTHTHTHIFVGSTSFFLRPFAILKQWSQLVFKSCLSKGSTRMNKNVRHDTYQRIF